LLAVTVAEVVPKVVGVPEINPVEALIESPDGRLVAAHAVAGRVEALVSAGVALKDWPAVPLKDWPAVIIGIAPVMVSEPVA